MKRMRMTEAIVPQQAVHEMRISPVVPGATVLIANPLTIISLSYEATQWKQ